MVNNNQKSQQAIESFLEDCPPQTLTERVKELSAQNPSGFYQIKEKAREKNNVRWTANGLESKWQ
ncbi:hypothetical protein ACFVQB_20920 [Paenibacillus sp. NPDC057886]|uniref:hypothetical protein n=1 Tax=Paenibacillus sp. NPDC057886 TaxID=3346270 RepID=UPI0036A97B94